MPPPTPANFPRCFPQDDAGPAPPEPLTALLQKIIRPTEIELKHLSALGVVVRSDIPLADLIPDPDSIPDFAKWDALSYDDAREANEATRHRMNTGNLSPGVQTYLDRKRELQTDNTAALRAVRRIQPPPGQALVRLGNSYEFFRNLEAFAMFWDDTSIVKPQTPPDLQHDSAKDDGPAEPGNGNPPDSGDAKVAKKDGAPPAHFYRTGAGHQMPPDYRLNILAAFLKLVTYDFGCNVSPSRTEPRLYINAPASPSLEHNPPAETKLPFRSSYFSSGCTFIFRSPQTREAGRQGIVEGPLAAVSARHTVGFPPPGEVPAGTADKDSTIDLARELTAALVTAQHRAREGRTEKRFGEGAWWATKPRWGGGPGGPIGREVDATSNTDEAVPGKDEGGGGSATALGPGSGHGGRPTSKKSRKNLPIYDGYRMVRPPSASWDHKTRYKAIGRAKGTDYDDVFVVSALFHHISIVRVRVPLRLLEVLDGRAEDVGGGQRSWGRLEVLRSNWFDLFKAAERVAALQCVWSLMAFLMRKEDEEDAKMEGSS